MNLWAFWLIFLFWAGVAALCWTCSCICGQLAAGWSRMVSLMYLPVDRFLIGVAGPCVSHYLRASRDFSHRGSVVRIRANPSAQALFEPLLVTFPDAVWLSLDAKSGDIDSGRSCKVTCKGTCIRRWEEFMATLQFTTVMNLVVTSFLPEKQI